jgi:anti-sigma B factor antagonist
VRHAIHPETVELADSAEKNIFRKGVNCLNFNFPVDSSCGPEGRFGKRPNLVRGVTMQTFKLVEKDLHPGCRVIQVEGELDLSVADQLREALERPADGCTQILIDLKQCEFIDSTGIATIVGAHNEMADQGRRVAVYAPSDQVLRVLAITGLTSNGLVFESVDKALADDAR